MGLSTHVLDTMHGCPAAGMTVKFYKMESASGTLAPQATLEKSFTLDADGRNPDGLLIGHAALKKGNYRLVFDVAGYFRAKGVVLPEPPFLNEVTMDFGIAAEDQHYHVPLLTTPWGYSTYRGS
jgi:5-hydroxyisourate hydrolase